MSRIKVDSMAWRILSHLSKHGKCRNRDIVKQTGSDESKLRELQKSGRITKVGFGVWKITRKGEADMLAAVVRKNDKERALVALGRHTIPLWSAAAHDRRRAHRRLSWSLGVAA